MFLNVIRKISSKLDEKYISLLKIASFKGVMFSRFRRKRSHFVSRNSCLCCRTCKCMQRQKKRELKSEQKMIIIIMTLTTFKKPKLFLRDQLLLIAVALRPKWRSILERRLSKTSRSSYICIYYFWFVCLMS